MAFKPKQILGSAVGLGKAAVSAVGRPLRRGGAKTDRAPSTPGTAAAKTVPKARGKAKAKPSGSPSTVGAPKPGKPRGPKSAAAGSRTTASQAAASSGKEVSDAASGKSD